MNKLFFPLFLLLCTTQMQAKDRTVTKPPFVVRNTSTLEIKEIELTKDSTIFYFDAFFRPNNWIRISSDSYLKANGKKYPVLSSEGIKLDDHFFMPASGRTSFKLSFAALPASTKSVDFIESDCDNCFKIWGIQLKSKKLPKFVLPKGIKIAPPEEKLPPVKIEIGKAIFEGAFIEMPQGMIKEFTLYGRDVFTYESIELKVPVNSEGKFHIETELSAPTTFTLATNIGSFTVLLAPGKELSAVINPREISRRQGRYMKEYPAEGEDIYFSGYLAGINTELNKNRDNIDVNIVSNYRAYFKEIANMTQEEYLHYNMSKHDSIIQVINAAPISNASKKLLRMETALSTVEALYAINNYLNNAYISVNNLKGKEADKYYSTHKIEIPKDYYQCIRNFPEINTSDIFYTPQLQQTTIMVKRFTMKEGIAMEDVLGDNKGVIYDLAGFLWITQKIKDFNPLTQDDFNALKAYNQPAWEAVVMHKNEKLIKQIEENKQKTGYNVIEIGDVKNEDLLNSLTSRYKGKTVLMDVWATWCGPCKMAMKAMKPMEEALAEKGVVFLFVAGENSPKGTWENMIPNIKGEHVRLNNEQWKYLSEKLKIRGVPSYFLFNKKGTTVWQSLGFPGVDTVKGEIMKTFN